MLRIQLCLVPGSVFLAPEPCQSCMVTTLQNAASSEVSTQSVPCPQSMGYIPSVWIHTECAPTAGCLYALKCVPTPKGMYIP